MQNLSDEDIDKLFKQAAEQQQPQFNPDDWSDMANRLETSKRPWSNYYTWTGVGLILGVVIWLGWFGNTPAMEMETKSISSNTQNEKTVASKQIADDLNNHSSQLEITNNSDPEIKNKDAAPSTLNEDNFIAQSKEKEKNSASSTSKGVNTLKPAAQNSSSIIDHSTNKLPSSASENPDQIKVANNAVVLTETNSAKDQGINKNSVTNNDLSNASKMSGIESIGVIPTEEENTIASDLKSEKNSSSANQINNDSLLPIIQSDVAIDSVENAIALEEETQITKAELDKQDSSSTKTTFTRFAIKATIAPDFSSDQFKTTDKMGFNFGVMAEYFLNKNISVSTGAIWSRKYYSAQDVDYNGYHADRAYGDCRMWDIPLNVNYYFTPSKKYSFYASAGLSSYLMNEENYDYEVDTPYGTSTYSSTVVKENQEWFKILNLSVGFQKQLNDRFAIQVEPFMKIPLAGVGDGNISLASFGSFFSLRYNFLSPQK